MNKDDICYMSACEMVDVIKRGEIPAIEITETLIERIEKINPIINAYCTTTFDLAREQAKKADDRVKNGEKLGLLNGIPTSIKDLVPVKGIRTTMGSKLFENNIAEVDSIVVQRLKAAGCVILGKTNTPEFGHKSTTDNFIFGITKNPWDLERTPGGSSGGAAAACAAGISPLALGSDGGGSIRNPSSLCGLFGIKPSFGRVPTYPAEGTKFWKHSQEGPLVRSVKDAALMLDVMKGQSYEDWDSLPNDNISYLDSISKDEKPNKLRIAFSPNLGYAKAVEPEVVESVINAAHKLEKYGWEVEEIKFKIKTPDNAYRTMMVSSTAFDLKKEVKKSRDLISPDLCDYTDLGLTISGVDVWKAINRRKTLYEDFQQKIFKNYDLLICPSSPIWAFRLDEKNSFPSVINGKGTGPLGFICFTMPFNMTGLPAASIPSGFSKEGLPIGMQIVGNKYQDLLVLQVAKAFEDIAPWQDKRPNL